MNDATETLDLINALAAKFSEIVRTELAEELDEIIEKNNSAEYNGCCATHDFCDANMLMNDAFEQVTGRKVFPFLEGDDDQKHNDYLESDQHAYDCDLWNAAWTKARNNNYQ